MILSVSRRTDIPCFYSDWFYGRMREGFLLVRNPMNARQVSRIDLSPEAIDCIVFWTKDPADMMGRLGELDGIPYYFQYTITGYGREVEPNVPDAGRCVETFRRLSERIGGGRVIWRYDPILLTDRYTPERHLESFGRLAESLRGYTRRVVISFVDYYRKAERGLRELGVREAGRDEMRRLARGMAQIARSNGLSVEACAEPVDLTDEGVARASCIDRDLVQELAGHPVKAPKDKGQRAECGCAQSVDVGAYHTCRNGCRYCYANYSAQQVERRARLYDPSSPLLCSSLREGDRITERKAAP